MKHLAQERHKI